MKKQGLKRRMRSIGVLLAMTLMSMFLGVFVACGGDQSSTEPPLPNEYTISFSVNNGYTIPEQIVEENALVEKPSDPTRDGYDFEGWYLGESLYDFSTPVTSDLSLTALWKAKTVGYTIMIFKEENSEYTDITQEYSQFSNLSAVVDSVVDLTAEVKSLQVEGYILDESGSILSGTVKADGSLRLFAYFLEAISVEETMETPLYEEFVLTGNGLTNVTYSSANPEIVGISENGKLIALSKGTCEVTVSDPSRGSATCVVTVTDPREFSVTWNTIDASDIVIEGDSTVVYGFDYTLTITYSERYTVKVFNGEEEIIPNGNDYIIKSVTEDLVLEIKASVDNNLIPTSFEGDNMVATTYALDGATTSVVISEDFAKDGKKSLKVTSSKAWNVFYFNSTHDLGNEKLADNLTKWKAEGYDSLRFYIYTETATTFYTARLFDTAMWGNQVANRFITTEAGVWKEVTVSLDNVKGSWMVLWNEQVQEYFVDYFHLVKASESGGDSGSESEATSDKDMPISFEYNEVTLQYSYNPDGSHNSEFSTEVAYDGKQSLKVTTANHWNCLYFNGASPLSNDNIAANVEAWKAAGYKTLRFYIYAKVDTKFTTARLFDTMLWGFKVSSTPFSVKAGEWTEVVVSLDNVKGSWLVLDAEGGQEYFVDYFHLSTEEA